MYVDPKLRDRGLSDAQRDDLVRRLGLIPADHSQLWRDSDLLGAWERRCTCDASERDSFGNVDRIPNPECPVHEL